MRSSSAAAVVGAPPGDDIASPVSPAGGARTIYVLALLSMVSFLNYADRMVFSVISQPLKIELGLSDTQLGLLSGLAFALMYAAAGLPIGRLADRVSRVRLLGGSVLIWSAATAATGFAGSFLHLAAARLGVGGGEAGAIPICHSLIGDYVSPKRRALAISIFQAGGIIGLSGGLIVAGLLTDYFGWRTAVFVMGAAGLPIAVIVLLTLREPARRGVGLVHPNEAWILTLRALFSRRTFVLLLLANTFAAFATYGIKQWLVVFFIRSHGLTLSQTSFWTGIATGCGGVFGVLLGGGIAARLVQRDPRWEFWVPAITYGIAAPLYAAVFFIPDTNAALLLQGAATVFSAGGVGVALSSIQSFAEPRRRATAIAVVLFFMALFGNGLGPLVIGIVSDALTPMLGTQSLRYAVLVGVTGFAVASIIFFRAAAISNYDRLGL